MKRVFTLFTTFCLLFALLVPAASAADSASAVKLNYELTANGSTSAAVTSGDTITVTFTIKRTDSQEGYSINALQNEIIYDQEFFEFVGGSIVTEKAGEETLFQTRTTGQNILKASDMTGSYAAEEVFCTFRLKVIGTSGSGSVSCSEQMAFDSTGAEIAVTAKNLTVSIYSGGGYYPSTPSVPSTPSTPDTKEEAGTTVEDGKATVTVDSDKLAEELENAAEGTEVTISAEVPEGETVTEVTAELPASDIQAVADSGASVKVETPVANVTLPNETLKDLAAESGETVVVSATSNDDGSVTVDIAADGKSVENVSGGITVSIPAEEISSGSVLVIVDEDGTETVVKKSVVDEGNVSALLSGSATVKVVDNSKEFTDVDPDAWYSEGVDFVSSREIFQGVGNDAFDPNGDMTRAMLGTVLHRMEDEMEHSYEGTFHDVEEDKWYTDAIHWAAEQGIVEGYGNGYFGTHDEITREQMITMVYRYLNWLGVDTSARGGLSVFNDHEEISSWALEAMEWGVGAGLIEGVGNNLLAPEGNATRAQLAVFMQRVMNLML